ncbi:transglycosylase SLT domain-containing protein [Actinacidiphila rubida]|uniref:Transglycosylase SLT domain-containing protein n=1 Tax=Actinacidiphila rubida TaxID=310780 RepID=A0A1H8S908_9ACTN|nr:transglycosylase SLT domain-containing protein [Actinacidiphila rubida]SEO75085.1 Transglycosylase SLT domain-containing protein [Actinacidiphila rubida]
MQLPTIPKIGRLSKKHKITAAGAAAATAVVLAVTGLQATGGGSASAAGDPTGYKVSTGAEVKKTDAAPDAKTDSASQKAIADQAAAAKKSAADAAAKKAAADALAKKKAADAAARKASADAAAKKAAQAAAVKRAAEKAAANRSMQRATLKAVPVAAKATPAAVKTYTNDLDGWIRHSLDVMAAHNIPGTYNGIYRNIIRESSGNPNAINLWDSNAAAGIPSKGLLQVINPTFNTYHVDGTSWDIYDPVANITAACNYAYHVYGTIDNVYSAY